MRVRGEVAIVALNKGGERTVDVPMGSLGVEGVTFDDYNDDTRNATVSGGNLPLTLGSWDYFIGVRR